eukprot:g6367.t1
MSNSGDKGPISITVSLGFNSIGIKFIPHWNDLGLMVEGFEEESSDSAMNVEILRKASVKPGMHLAIYNGINVLHLPSEEVEKIIQRHEEYWKSRGGTTRILTFRALRISAKLLLCSNVLSMNARDKHVLRVQHKWRQFLQRRQQLAKKKEEIVCTLPMGAFGMTLVPVTPDHKSAMVGKILDLGSQAARSGARPGLIIAECNGMDLQDLDFSAVIGFLRKKRSKPLHVVFRTRDRLELLRACTASLVNGKTPMKIIGNWWRKCLQKKKLKEMIRDQKEEKKAEEEAAAKKKAEEEAAVKKKAEEEAAAKKKAEEEAAAKKKAEEEAAAKKKAEEEAAAKKKAEEEAAAKKKAEEEAAAKKKAEEKAAAKKKAEEEAAAKKRAEEEAAAKKRAEEEAVAKKKAEEEAAAKKKVLRTKVEEEERSFPANLTQALRKRESSLNRKIMSSVVLIQAHIRGRQSRVLSSIKKRKKQPYNCMCKWE